MISKCGYPDFRPFLSCHKDYYNDIFTFYIGFESNCRNNEIYATTGKKVDTIKRYYRVDRRDIFFIQSIYEGYEGLATMSTIDPIRGVIRLSMHPDTETDVLDILQDLKASGVLIEDVVPV